MANSEKPTFNHAHNDGPLNPCPLCLILMGKRQLRELVRSMQARMRDMENGRAALQRMYSQAQRELGEIND